MKPVVDESCIGCGTCEAICPAVFKIEEGSDHIVATVQAVDFDANHTDIESAIASCPTQSIVWEE
ncbi:MAG: ferredoxin [bacterium]